MAAQPLNPHSLPQRRSTESTAGPLHGAQASSHVRDVVGRNDDRAVRRVIEYLKILGLTDSERASAFAYQCAESSRVDDAVLHACRAMSEAQRRVSEWKADVFADVGGEPNSLWLRLVLSQRPELFLLEPALAKPILVGYGDPRSGRLPANSRFKKQRLSPPRVPRWLIGLMPSLLLTTVAVHYFKETLVGELGVLGAAWISIYAILLGILAVGCVTAVRGFFQIVFDRASPVEPNVRFAERTPRVAIAVPVYHEDAAQVFANVAAMRETLSPSKDGVHFEFFVLSDSRDPWCAADEERAFRRLTAESDEEVPIYYRRRAQNERQKAGNIEEFFERWGGRYDYVFVLDADSLMQGATMTEMVRRMERHPQWGMLQAPIALIGGDSVLCRALQWSTSVVGPLFTHGLSAWAGPHGNYYGHNAIIRTSAFLRCCALPTLAGNPPFGGSIMSHDFVEAALLCRGGWQVRTATDLTGSYEGCPSTFADYVARDRRWCQGNLQHLRIVAAPGLKMMSRLHLFFGAAAYLAAPLWLAFVVVGLFVTQGGGWNARAAEPFLILMVGLLFLPRLLGLVATLIKPEARRAHGGMKGLIVTLPFEVLFTSALAPLLLFHHSVIVLKILVGGFVQWNAQNRRSKNSLWYAVRAELPATLSGILLAACTRHFAPDLTVWLAPVWGPLCFAIPLSLLAGSARVGAFLRARGLLLIPSETRPEPLEELSQNFKSLTESDHAGRMRDLILDPVLLEAHISRLAPSPSRNLGSKASLDLVSSTGLSESQTELCRRALRLGPSGLNRTETSQIAADPDSLRWLHREAWCHWPVEEWRLSRERPQVPESSVAAPPSCRPSLASVSSM